MEKNISRSGEKVAGSPSSLTKGKEEERERGVLCKIQKLLVLSQE